MTLFTANTAVADVIPDGRAYAEIKELAGALNLFHLECGRLPSQAEGLSALLRRPSDIPASKWQSYLTEIPLADPWGNPYVYRCPGIHYRDSFDLYSLGADGISKSGGDDRDDINDWDANRHWESHYSEGRSGAARRSEAFMVAVSCGSLGLLILLMWYQYQRRFRTAEGSVTPAD